MKLIKKQLNKVETYLKTKIVSLGINPPEIFNETLKIVKFCRGSASLRA